MKMTSAARLVLTIVFALAFSLLTVAQSSQPVPQKFERDKLVEDFQIARQALEEGHSGIYRYTNKAELDRVFDAALKSIDRPMDAFEFYRVLAPVVATIKCGHTGVWLPDATRKDLNNSTPLLPLRIRVINKRAYAFRDFSDLASPSGAGSLAGKEIQSINGVPASRIVATMLAAVGADGDVQTAREVRISGPQFSVNLISLLGLTSPYDLVVSDPGSKQQQKVRLNGVDLPKLREASKARYPQDEQSGPAATLKFADDGKIAQMTILGFGGFVDAEKKKGIRDFYKESFEALQTKGSKALIIDLRGNGGGEDELGQLLVSYLINEPFKYYNDLVINAMTFSFGKYTQSKVQIPENRVEKRDDGKVHAIGHPNWGIKQPSQPHFAGKVFILIDGGSFSTTSEFLSQAHFHKLATFIGEESGGGYYGNSSGFMPSLTLPNTGLTLRVPLMTYYMAVSGYKQASHGVIPDYPVEHTIADLIAGRDKDMELALRLARK
ncbi:MAG TPA: S41 family peptidase [Blastocatellia bacterium]|nr:S41 family peptidase [Blastocatellia bacterium]